MEAHGTIQELRLAPNTPQWQSFPNCSNLFSTRLPDYACSGQMRLQQDMMIIGAAASAACLKR